MNRIDQAFHRLGRKKRKGLIAYLTAGDPNLRWTLRLVRALENAGCDMVELGVPFSDPLADGVVNQRAAERALKSGTSLSKILHCVEQIRQHSQIPLLLFSYFNPVHAMGLGPFARVGARAGLDGILLLDVPLEESVQTRKILRAAGLKNIFLIAPTSGENRIRAIAKKGSGFLYCISRTGVTGNRKALLNEAAETVRKIRRASKLPIAVGFGISQPKQAKAIGRFADAVVVGSAIVGRIEKNPSNPVPAVASFVRQLRKALDNSHG